MKKFAAFLTLFLASLFAVDRLGAWLLESLHQRVIIGHKGGRTNAYLQRLTPPPVVLMGNSRLSLNVNPDSLYPEALSIAHNGTSQIFQTGLLSLMQQRGKLPPTILLHVDLDEYVRPSHLADIRNLKNYYGETPLITAYSNDISRLEPIKHASRLYRYNGWLFSIAKNLYLQRSFAGPEQGFEPYAPSPQDSLVTHYSSQKLAQEPGHLNRGHLRYLQDFVQLCRQHNVQLVCFTASYFQPPHYIPAASAMVDSLLWAQGVPYLNYARHPIGELTARSRYWRDATHLNARGIPLHTRQLALHLQPHLLAPPAAIARQPAPADQATSLD